MLPQEIGPSPKRESTQKI